MKMRKGISGAAFIAIALVGLGIVATLFTTGGGSALSKTDLPAIKASVIDTIEQIEKNQVIFYMNKNTYTGSYITSSFKEGYISADSWTDKLKTNCQSNTDGESIVDINSITPNKGDCFISDNIRYHLYGDEKIYTILIDMSRYSTETSILKELEEFVSAKLVSKYGQRRVKKNGTYDIYINVLFYGVDDQLNYLETNKLDDGQIMVTILRTY